MAHALHVHVKCTQQYRECTAPQHTAAAAVDTPSKRAQTQIATHTQRGDEPAKSSTNADSHPQTHITAKQSRQQHRPHMPIRFEAHHTWQYKGLCTVATPITTAQHSTAQHSTAQHSAAQHSTAQRSAAQHSTDRQVCRQGKNDSPVPCGPAAACTRWVLDQLGPQKEHGLHHAAPEQLQAPSPCSNTQVDVVCIVVLVQLLAFTKRKAGVGHKMSRSWRRTYSDVV